MLILMDIRDNVPRAYLGARTSMMMRAAGNAREGAVAMAAGATPPVSPALVSAELANQVLPNLEAILRVGAALPGRLRARLVTELSEQRRELGRLVEQLDRLLLDAAARPRSVAARRRTAQTLDAVACLLDRHLGTDEELGACLEGEADRDQGWALLDAEAEASERLAARSLRFVWHPPVAATEALAIRRNPKASRVVILDASEALAAGGGAEEGHRRRSNADV